MTTPATIAAAPIIQATDVRDIVEEQDVLPLTQEAKESDENMILDLSEIDTNAATLHNSENYKPNCIFRQDVLKKPFALWRDWHSGIRAIHRNKKMLKIWKKDWTPNPKKNIVCEGGYQCNKSGKECGGSI
jgi:hypothetical protein